VRVGGEPMAPPGGDAGYPPEPQLGDAGGPIWEVVGGADRGGIVVRMQQELGSTLEPTRLSTGALVLELELVGERLHYGLLQGSGPNSGWVSTKLKDKELLIRTGQILPPVEEAQGQAGQAGAGRGQGARQQQPPGRGRGRGKGGPPDPAHQWEHESLFTEPEPAAPRRPANSGVRWIPGSGTAGGKYAKLDAVELEEACRERELEIAKIESRAHAAELLECLDRLERMRVPELKNEVKKRGMATTVGATQSDLTARLREALVWERMRVKPLSEVCREKQLPMAGDEMREDLLQMLAYSSWEARGVPVWRMPSDTVAHGILDQLDRLEAKSPEELALICEKKNLPVEENLPAKDVLIGRLRTAIVWDQMPIAELRQECLDLGVPAEELDEMGCREEQQQGAAWRPRPFGSASPESIQREAMVQRLLEQMWMAYEDGLRISQYFQILGLPETATVEDVKKTYKKLALRYHPDKSEQGEQEMRTQDFQLLSEAYESLLAYIKAVQGEATAGEGQADEDGEEDAARPQTAVFMARHGERLDDAELAKGRLWVRSAERPWDPPLSERGRLQAMALGKAIRQHAEKLGLPAVTRIFTSPFLRCVETAVEAARQLEVRNVCVEPSLCESFCESFYRAWCVPGANGDWGGPENCRNGVEVDPERLKNEARGPASELLHPVWLKHAKGSAGRMSKDYEPFLPLSELRFTWGDFETEEQYTSRLRAFFDFAAGAFPGEGAVFISHAGPLKMLFANLKPDLTPQMPGYCALYLLHRPQSSGADGGPAEWQAPLAADVEHMRRWARDRHGAEGGGPFGRGSRRLPREGPGLF